MSGRPSSTTPSPGIKSPLVYVALVVAAGLAAGIVGLVMTLCVDALLVIGAHDDPGPAHWATAVSYTHL